MSSAPTLTLPSSDPAVTQTFSGSTATRKEHTAPTRIPLTYLERDLRQLSQIDSLTDFHRVMETLALRSGQMLNQTDVARDAGMTQPTIRRYLNLLEATYLFERLPAFSRNRTKRLIKTRKVYFLDPGLATYLTGLHTAESLRSSGEVGGIFEVLVFLHLRVFSHLIVPGLRLHYLRTATSHKVDFVIEQGRAAGAGDVVRRAGCTGGFQGSPHSGERAP